MRAVSPADQLFLWIEKRHQPMHVGGLMLVKLPADAEEDFVHRTAERLRAATEPRSPFDKQLVSRFGTWFWERDEQFDIEHHFRHLALPRPGRIRELLQLVSQLHASPLDRARPLWEMYLIEGVEGGRAAIYTKVHHSLVDGVAAMRLVQRTLSEDPNERNRPPPWSIARSERPTDAEPPSEAIGGLRDIFAAAGTQLSSMSKVTRELAKTMREAGTDEGLGTGLVAPRSILNQRVTSSRRFAAQSYSLERIREVAQAKQATLNDVVLAMCSSALRRYLVDLAALPDKPLIAMVPMSLRRDESASGNQIAMILTNLGTHLSHPGERLRVIQRSVQTSKARYAKMSPTEILAYAATLLGPAGLNFLTGAAPKVQAFNVVISNVPGPKKPLYFDGAKVEGIYPVSIVVDGQAVNITITSYVDKLEFGIIACRRTLPHIQRLLEYLERGLVELEELNDYDELP